MRFPLKSTLDRLRVFGLRELLTHPGRALASAIVVAVSTALLVAVLSIVGSIDNSVANAASGVSGDASVEVTAVSGGGFSASVLRDVAAADHVEVAAPLIRSTVTTAIGPLSLIGVDGTAAGLNSPLQEQFRTAWTELLSVRNAVIVGPGTGLVEGQQLRIQDLDVTVAGVASGPAAERFGGGRYVLAPLPLATSIMGRGDVLDAILVVGSDGVNPADDVRSAVAGRASVGAPDEQRTAASNGVLLIRYVAISAAAMAFLVTGFLVYTAMSMTVTARRPRISMLRAVGGTSRSLVGDLILESAVLAAVGAAVGSVIGIFLGRFAIGQLPALFLQSVSARVEFALPVWAVPLAIVVAVLVSVTAAALTARQVYRVSPVEALVPVDVSRVSAVSRRKRVAAAILGVVLIGVSFFNATSQPGILANSGITMMFAAEIALGFAAGTALVWAAAQVASRLGAGGPIAGETIHRAPTRSWATVMTVAVAVAATFAISAGNANAVDSTRASFESLRDGDIWVSTSPVGTFPTGPALPSDTVRAVQDTAGVAEVTPAQAAYVTLGDERALMFGLANATVEPLVSRLDDDTRRRVLAGDGVVLSRDLAESLSVRTGDEVEIPTREGPRQLSVLAEVPYFSALNGAMAVSLPQMQQWLGLTGSSSLQIAVADGADVSTTLEAIRAVLPDGVSAYTGDDAIAGYGDALTQATSLNHLIWIIVTVIAAVALLNTLLLSVLERRREIAVLRAIGSSRRFVIGTVVAESLGIAIVGALLGLVFGAVQQFVADLASSRAWNVDVAYELVPLSFAMAAGALVLCLLGAVPPTQQVSRLNITEAMRIE